MNTCDLNCEFVDELRVRPFSVQGRLAPVWFKGGGKPSIDDTEDQKEIAKIASERWDVYQSEFVPAENEYIDEMRNYDNAERMEQVSGAAATGTESAYGEAVKNDVKAITSSGTNVNSGAFNQAINNYQNDSAGAKANNTTRTQQAIQDQKVQGIKNVVAIGNGQATEAISGMNKIASDSAADAASRAKQDFNRRQSNFDAAGRLAGTAYSAIKEPESKE